MHWEPETAGDPSIATLLASGRARGTARGGPRPPRPRSRRPRAPPASPCAFVCSRLLPLAKPGFLAGIAIGALAVALVGIAIPWRAGGLWIGWCCPDGRPHGSRATSSAGQHDPAQGELARDREPQVGAEPMLLTPVPDLLTLPAHEALSVSKARCRRCSSRIAGTRACPETFQRRLARCSVPPATPISPGQAMLRPDRSPRRGRRIAGTASTGTTKRRADRPDPPRGLAVRSRLAC